MSDVVCEEAVAVLEAEARGDQQPIAGVMDAFTTLEPPDGACARDPGVLGRAAAASVTLLDSERLLPEGRWADAPELRVRHLAGDLLEAATGRSFGRLATRSFWNPDGEKEGVESDRRIRTLWRSWWATYGADVRRWMAEGDRARARRAEAARDDGVRRVHEARLRFTITSSAPLLTWDPRWPPISRLDSPRAEIGDWEPIDDELATLLEEHRSVFVRDGFELVQVGITRRDKRRSWASLGFGRRPVATLFSAADHPAQAVLVWPSALGDLSARPALDDARLAWLEANDPEFHAHVLRRLHFEAWVFDGQRVHRVTLRAER